MTKSADGNGFGKLNDGLLKGFEGCEGKTKRLIEIFNDLITNRAKNDFVPRSVKECLEELQEALRKSKNYME